METKYKVNDVVYYVKEFHVVKSVVNKITITEDSQGTTLLYTLVAYNKKAKPIVCVEAQLVDTLKIAKQSALTNWERITKQVKNDLEQLTEKDFEPDEQPSK